VKQPNNLQFSNISIEHMHISVKKPSQKFFKQAAFTKPYPPAAISKDNQALK